MGGIRPDVHQMGDGLAAPALGDAFEQLAHLEEQHDEHSLGELRLGAREEADGEGSERCHAHEEVLVQRFSMDQRLSRLLQGLPTDDEIGD